MPFQTVTNAVQAPGMAGDFASANPRATLLSSVDYNSAGFRAGPNGLTIGLFAWLDPATYTFASNSGAGAPNGFVHREAQGLITTYLTEYGYTIPAGFGCSCIFDSGDFFVVNNGTTEAAPGMKAYANNTTGVATFAATGSPTTSGVSASTATIAAETGAFTGSIADNVLTVTAVGTGLVVPGSVIAGSGIATGTMITAQLTSTASGGALSSTGTYSVTPRDQTFASGSITSAYGLFAPGTLASGAFAVGQTLSGSGVTTGTYITAASATAGDWIVTPSQTANSETITGYSNTETSWYCRSFGAVGDVVKISSRAMG